MRLALLFLAVGVLSNAGIASAGVMPKALVDFESDRFELTTAAQFERVSELVAQLQYEDHPRVIADVAHLLLAQPAHLRGKTTKDSDLLASLERLAELTNDPLRVYSARIQKDAASAEIGAVDRLAHHLEGQRLLLLKSDITDTDRLRFLYDTQACFSRWYRDASVGDADGRLSSEIVRWLNEARRVAANLKPSARAVWQLQLDFSLAKMFFVTAQDPESAEKILLRHAGFLPENKNVDIVVRYQAFWAALAGSNGRAEESAERFRNLLAETGPDSPFADDMRVMAADAYARLSRCRDVEEILGGMRIRGADVVRSKYLALWRDTLRSKCFAVSGRSRDAEQLVASVENTIEQSYKNLSTGGADIIAAGTAMLVAVTTDANIKIKRKFAKKIIERVNLSARSSSGLTINLASTLVAEAQQENKVRRGTNASDINETAEVLGDTSRVWILALRWFTVSIAVVCAYAVLWASWLRPRIYANSERAREPQTGMLTARATRRLLQRISWERPWFGMSRATAGYLVRIDAINAKDFVNVLGRETVDEALARVVRAVEDTLRGRLQVGVLGENTFVVADIYGDRSHALRVAARLKATFDSTPILQLSTGKTLDLRFEIVRRTIFFEGLSGRRVAERLGVFRKLSKDTP